LIEKFKKPENKNYQILPTMVESRNKSQGVISTDLNSRYGDLVISPGIAKWGGFSEAVGAGKSALSLFKKPFKNRLFYTPKFLSYTCRTKIIYLFS